MKLRPNLIFRAFERRAIAGKGGIPARPIGILVDREERERSDLGSEWLVPYTLDLPALKDAKSFASAEWDGLIIGLADDFWQTALYAPSG